MNMPQSAKYILGVAAAAALLAGCSSGATSSLAPTGSAPVAGGASKLMHNGHVLSTSILDPKVQIRKSDLSKSHPLHGKIDARTKTFWISDSGDNVVQVFSYPSGTYMGALSAPPEGFSEPQGMCSDKNGNVFIANTENSKIDEYAANGTYMQSLSDPGEYPAGCAVDPKSGTLAVSNIIATSGYAGGISLYNNASGSPQTLSDPNMYEVFFVGYLGKTGNLYYSGFNNNFYAAVSSYIGGNFALLNISGATIGFPGTVSNAHKTGSLAIGDQDTFYGPTFYQVERHRQRVRFDRSRLSVGQLRRRSSDDQGHQDRCSGCRIAQRDRQSVPGGRQRARHRHRFWPADRFGSQLRQELTLRIDLGFNSQGARFGGSLSFGPGFEFGNGSLAQAVAFYVRAEHTGKAWPPRTRLL